jgi:hypothetical protein
MKKGPKGPFFLVQILIAGFQFVLDFHLSGMRSNLTFDPLSSFAQATTPLALSPSGRFGNILSKLVKALIAISSDIYTNAEFGAENFNRMFPNLPEGDKAKGVVAWAKELNGSKVKFDLIPDKWKSRTNWKPAIKI